MAYAILDVGFWSHPKVLDLLEDPDALAAIGLWALCLAWAKEKADPDDQGTAGHIPASLVRRVGGSDHLAELLCKAGLWEANGTGWNFHDFTGWQQLEAWRIKKELGRKGGRPRRSEPSANHMVLTSDDDKTAGQNHMGTHMGGTYTSTSTDTDPPSGGPRGVLFGGEPPPKPPPSPPRPSKTSARDSDPGFARFWAAFPRKIGKDAAWAAWGKALKRGATKQEMIDGAERYAADPARKPDYTCHPSTWLNQGRWADEHDDKQSRSWWEEP